MTRLIMGNKPSANASQIALKETAFIDGNDEKYPNAKIALTEDSYVNNTFITSDSISNIQLNISNVEYVASQGGFFYKPWVVSGQKASNVQLLMTPPSNSSHDDIEKALGVYWDVESDTFFIKVEAGGRKRNISLSLSSFVESPRLKLTLRDGLSLHSRPFDPIGFILPVKMNGFLLFRQTLQELSSKSK